MRNTVACLLEEAFLTRPDKIYIKDETESVTYKELRENALRLADGFIRRGFAGKPIIITLPRDRRAITCFLACAYIGCPYAPADTIMPPARLKKIADGLCPAAIITAPEYWSDEHDKIMTPIYFEDFFESQNPLFSADGGSSDYGGGEFSAVFSAMNGIIDTDPVYIMFTSGSTGNPKGVAVSHRGVLDYADWVCETFGFNGDTILANQAPLFFDNSIFDIYGALRCGGKLIFIPEILMTYQNKIPEFLSENSVTAIFWVPTIYKNIAASGVLDNIALPALKILAFCGEVMPNAVLNIWRRALPDRVFANLYGPTEITDACCYYIIDREFADSEPLPIGKACENTRILILDENNRRCAENIIGEICVLGVGAALGYWNDTERSSAVFVKNPLQNSYYETIYRTGDLAYIDGEGLLQFIGRRDSQIKLKGNRIELGEIENAAMCVNSIKNACCMLDAQHEQLVLFIECDEEWTLRKINLELKKYISKYMLPGRLVVMIKLPYTQNGKINRVKLREEYLA